MFNWFHLPRCTQTRRQSPTGPLHVLFKYLFMLFSITFSCNQINVLCALATNIRTTFCGRKTQAIAVPWNAMARSKGGNSAKDKPSHDKGRQSLLLFVFNQWLGRPRCREVEQVTGASNLRSTLGQNHSKPISKCSAQRTKPKTNHM